MSKSTLGVIVSFLLTVASTVAPVPDEYRLPSFIGTMALTMVACVWWLVVHRRESRAGTPKGFRLDALPPIPDLKNLTQNLWYKSGKPIFTGDAVVSVTNLLPDQGIDLVNFRLLRLTPSMPSFRGSWKPPTQDAVLKRVEFSDDIPANTTLAPGKTLDVRLFKATRPPAAQSLGDINVAFYGQWPSGYLKAFRPSARHTLVVEVTGNGVARVEAAFELTFSANPAEPVFALTRIDPMQP